MVLTTPTTWWSCGAEIASTGAGVIARAEASLGCATGFPTALRNFRHFSPEVPDSLHIRSYPCIFHFLQPLVGNRKSAAKKQFVATPASPSTLDRTQEVGGSNPPSSIGGRPCTRALRFLKPFPTPSGIRSY